MNQYFANQLDIIAAQGNLRNIPPDTTELCELTDLSTNDYLGLATDINLRKDFFDNIEAADVPMSSTASRLLASSQKYYNAFEDRLKELYGREILLMNSGYHVNTGIIPAITSPSNTLIIADRLVHASIIDGIMLSKCKFVRFPHNDFDRLEKIVAQNASQYDRILIITESVYSMDGDRADIPRLISIRRQYPNVMLYVDDAHAFGVEGPAGLGLVAEYDNDKEVDIIVGTFGKAAASIGAFCAVNHSLKQYLLNRARSFIFSTALPPMCAAWTRFVVDKIVGMDERRRHLKSLAQRLWDGLVTMKVTLPPEPSHIVPIIVGAPEKALDLSSSLMKRNFKVLPIRVPTVPPGTDRLRVSLSGALSEKDVDSFLKSIREVL